jgi:NTE family protein
VARRPGPGHDEVEALAGVPLFAGVTPEVIADLAAAARRVRIEGGRWLFHEGDPDDGLYVLVSGRVELVLEGPPATTVRVVGPGEALGEMALLAAGTRSASARALRDVELLHVTRDRFAELVAGDPAFARGLLRLLATKLVDAVPAQRPAVPLRTLAIVGSPGAGTAVHDLTRSLAASLASAGSTSVVGRSDVPDDPREWGRVVDGAERTVDWVVLDGEDGPPGPWRAFCLRQADRAVYLVPNGPAADVRLPDDVAVHLALVRGAQRPAGVAAAHHVLERGLRGATVDRLARRLSGNAVGLVLSGGGARGLAHVGVIERLLEAGIEIDRVGGVSIGALLGSLFASGLDVAELRSVCRTELVERHPFSDFTVSRVSVIRGRRATQMIRRLCGDAEFEDLPRSFFCVTADLVSAQPVVHRSGPIWRAVAASICIPGYAPPQRTPEGLLVDGGVLNNLPVDVMAAEAEGPVIAVDVMRQPSMSRDDRARLPNIMETLTRSSVLGSWARSKANLEHADLVVAPAVEGIGLLEWRAIDTAVEAGRAAADAALAGGWPERR